MQNDVDYVTRLLFSIVMLVFFIWSIVWAFTDAAKRQKSGCLVALLVAFFVWPFGLLIWLIFRPNDSKEISTGKSIKSRKPKDAPEFGGFVLRCDDCDGLLINSNNGLVCPCCSEENA